MGWMFCTGTCCVCHGLCTFNPDLVPSTTVNGHREPICRACIERANPLRIAKGLPAIVIQPGAYEPQEVA